MNLLRSLVVIWVVVIAACGGGGGSSSSSPPAVPTNPPPPPASNPPPPAAVSTAATGVVSGGVGLGAFTGDALSSGSPIQLDIAIGLSAFDIGISGSGFDIGISGSGISLGGIDGFGSIIVNDRTINTAAAAFSIDGGPGTQADLKQGQDVLVILEPNSDDAIAVLYRPMVEGPVTAVNAVDAELGTADLTVLGQRVLINGSTIVNNVAVMALAVGDLLEVSGVLEESGAIAASFVERSASLASYKVTGVVQNPAATTFEIGGLTVDFAAATLENFPNDVIEPGNVVEARGLPADFIAPTLGADRVQLLPILRTDESASAQVEGFIDSFASAQAFTVQSQRVVTTPSTQYFGGTEASLALGVKVDVRGTVDAGGNLVADQVTILATNAIRAEGPLTSVDAVGLTASLLGVTFTIRDGTSLEDDSAANVEPLTLANLSAGDYVELRGFLDGDTLVAVRLERDDFDARARLRGPVTAVDVAGTALTILDVAVDGQVGVTSYEDLDDSALTEAVFFDRVSVGDFVKATWDNFTDTGQVADELSLED